MEKQMDVVAQQAPELVPLVASSRLTLKKRKLEDHVAKVVLVLDISQSMSPLYRNGKVAELVAKTMALGFNIDEDGDLEVIAFGTHSHYAGTYNISNYRDCVSDILSKYPLEPGTDYSQPFKMLMDKYGDSDLPVYVQFVTDGDTQNRQAAEHMLRELSSKPCFIQCMAVGEVDYMPSLDEPVEEVVSKSEAPATPAPKRGLFSRLLGIGGDDSVAPARSVTQRPARNVRLPDGFSFLANLDDLEGRVIDNANFFAIKDPASIDNDKLYGLLMNEYPQWLQAARVAKII